MNEDARPSAAGAILAGGASRRMGTAKALIEVDGATLLERVAAALTAGGCVRIAIIGIPPTVEPERIEELAARHGWLLVADRHPGEGPLGGILTALAALPGEVLVTACDLVDLDAATVRSMLAPTDPDVDVVQAMTDRPEPLLSRWSPSARARLEVTFAAGERRVHVATSELRVEHRTVDPAALRNVNTPSDLGSPPVRRGSVPDMATTESGEKDEFPA